jgi:NADPH-dependent 2,4-dienoyl-CoA reductase/sulfur reductase-like enzyme
MCNSHTHNYDVLVLGAGPAGIAAACSAAPHATVGIVDENPAPGGQIWRNSFTAGSPHPAAHWHNRIQHAPVTSLHGLRVFATPAPNTLHAEADDGLHILRFKKLILATGARERFLPFPGWTLPNVTGAGALQAMVKSGLPIAGKRVVIAGSGPLLIAVAAFLKRHYARVICICEQAPIRQMLPFAKELVTDSAKLSQALLYRLQLLTVPYRTGWWPAIARGQSRLETITITNGTRRYIIPCDYLACGFHLVPNIELPSLLGCSHSNGFVAVDATQQTSLPNIYAAGEITGIGGLEKSLIEGSIAGLAAAGRSAEAQNLAPRRRKVFRFAAAMQQTFALRPELRNLPAPSTIVCRCEDVPHSQLTPHASWRSAKLHTRCGMGPCQGRICGVATEFLYGWPAESVRPPILPVRIETLAPSDNPASQELTAAT